MAGTVAIYYFSFPHYRRAILEELLKRNGIRVLSGSATKANLSALTERELPGLARYETWAVGPLTWDIGVVRVVSASDVAVLGPAITSVSTWAILVWRRVRGRPSYLWGRFGSGGDRRIRILLLKTMARLASKLLVYGEKDLIAAIRQGADSSRVTVVGNAVHSNRDVWGEVESKFAYERMRVAAARASNCGQLVLVHAGRIRASKKPGVMLDAIGILKRVYPDTQLHLIGDGPELGELRGHKHADHVRFYGALYDADRLTEIFQMASLVVASHNMGLLAIDALRAGTPVLVPDDPSCGPEVEALTPGVNALAFKAGDARSLATAADNWVRRARGISEADYVAARSAALRHWDASRVADAVIQALEV